MGQRAYIYKICKREARTRSLRGTMATQNHQMSQELAVKDDDGWQEATDILQKEQYDDASGIRERLADSGQLTYGSME